MCCRREVVALFDDEEIQHVYVVEILFKLKIFATMFSLYFLVT